MMQQPTVLIIDNSSQDRESYHRYLLQDGEKVYTILEAESGDSALALCQKLQPDCILLEYLLPDINGLDFVSRLKQQSIVPPVIMVTGHGNEAVAVQAMKNGVQDYLVKNETTPEILRSTVQFALKNTQLRRQLQGCEQGFRTSVENMLDCFSIYSSIRDEAGNIIDFKIDYVNTAACKLNQMTSEEQLGKRLCEIFPDHLTTGLFEEYCQVVETGKPLVKESFIYTDFGNQKLTKAFNIRASKLEDGFIAAWRDVTENKQAQAALRQSEAKFRRIVESNIFGVYFGDFSGMIYEANDAFLEIMGYTREELEAGLLYWNRITPPEYHALDGQKIQELKAKGFCTPFEKEYISKNGIRLPILLGIASIDGRENGYSACFVLDLSKRKQAESALSQSEERYRYLSEAVPQIVWICNRNGEFEYVNQKWSEYTGQPIEEVMRLGWLKFLHPDDLPIVMQTWNDTVHTGQLYEVEVRFRVSDGNYRWFLTRALPMRNEEGRVVKWFGTTTDIDDRKKLEAERADILQREQAARAEAEAANQAKDDFVAMVSHDLRSPLNSILGWAKLLRTRQLDAATTHKALEIIERNAKSQAILIEDLLDMSRIRRGTLQIKVSPIDIVGVIHKALETAYPTAKDKSIHLNFALDEVPKISGDPNRLQQVLGNLLSNAIKFTNEGGRVEVRLSMEKSQRRDIHPITPTYAQTYAQITVTDTGIGISPELLPHIFERYHQKNKHDPKGGLGLGLAISRQLVELHGGTLRAISSGEGRGAKFIILLPC